MSSKILIVIANYYQQIANDLIKAAETTLDSQSKTKVEYKTVLVPGIFEIPVLISRNLKKI